MAIPEARQGHPCVGRGLAEVGLVPRRSVALRILLCGRETMLCERPVCADPEPKRG